MNENYDNYIESLILSAAQAGNVLPLTSSCNMCCLFCSHRQNPAGVEVFRIKPRSVAEVERTLSFMEPVYPVVIGESVTRIIEGEPFTHPAIMEILALIRTKFSGTAIQITTNGSLLEEQTVDKLRRLGGMVINLSLNSATETGRALLMGDRNARKAIEAPLRLKEYGIPFHGSVVAMPHVVGWRDLDHTIKYLSDCGAETIRIFLPGYSKLAPPVMRFTPSLWHELNAFVAKLRETLTTPLTCEPPVIDDLKPWVTGVIAGSPAERAGIRAGDLIAAVNNTPPISRVHAFNLILQKPSPELTLLREQKNVLVKINKLAGERSGIVMDYDLDPGLIERVSRLIQRRRAARVLMLTSEFAGPVLKMALAHHYQGTADIQVAVVQNNYFGGSIKTAGLLTVEDFSRAVSDFISNRPAWAPQLVLLPGMAFDQRGRDLTGRFYRDLAPLPDGLEVEAL